MDHRLFENWITDRKPLKPAEKRALAAHLQTCRACTALQEVDTALHTARQAEPESGFVLRFQERLAARRIAIRRRNRIGFALLALAVTGLLLGIVLPTLTPLIQAPSTALAGWASSLINIWSSLQAFGQVSRTVIDVLPGFVPPVLYLVFVFGGIGWGLMWILSLMKFTQVRQGA